MLLEVLNFLWVQTKPYAPALTYRSLLSDFQSVIAFFVDGYFCNMQITLKQVFLT